MQADVILKELPPTGTPPQPLRGAHVGGGRGAPPIIRFFSSPQHF